MLAFDTARLLAHLQFVFLPKWVSETTKDIQSHVRLRQLDRHTTRLEMVYQGLMLSSVLRQPVEEENLGGNPNQEMLIFAPQLKSLLESVKSQHKTHCLIKTTAKGAQLIVHEHQTKHHLTCSAYYGNPTDFHTPSFYLQPLAKLNGPTLSRMCSALQSVSEFKEERIVETALPVFLLRFEENQAKMISSSPTNRSMGAVVSTAIERLDSAEPVDFILWGGLLNRLKEMGNLADTVHVSFAAGEQECWVQFATSNREILCRPYKLNHRPPFLLEWNLGRYDPIPKEGTCLWERTVLLPELTSAAQVQKNVERSVSQPFLIITEAVNAWVILPPTALDGAYQSKIPLSNKDFNEEFTPIQAPASFLAQTLQAFLSPFIDPLENPDRQIRLSLWQFPLPRQTDRRYIYFLRAQLPQRDYPLVTTTIHRHVLEGADTSE